MLEFDYEENTAVKYSCAAVLNDEMYVFSGPHLVKHQPVDTFKQVKLETRINPKNDDRLENKKIFR